MVWALVQVHYIGVDVKLYYSVFQLSNAAENIWILLLQDPTNGLWVCAFCCDGYPYFQ